MYKRKRAGNTITRKINSTKDTAAKADKNHYISNSYLEGFIPIDTEYFTASSQISPLPSPFRNFRFRPMQGVACSCMVTDILAYFSSFLLSCAFSIQQSFRA